VEATSCRPDVSCRELECAHERNIQNEDVGADRFDPCSGRLQKKNAVTASGSASATHDAASQTPSPSSAEINPKATISAMIAGTRRSA
jgi:hypothetical protein